MSTGPDDRAANGRLPSLPRGDLGLVEERAPGLALTTLTAGVGTAQPCLTNAGDGLLGSSDVARACKNGRVPNPAAQERLGHAQKSCATGPSRGRRARRLTPPDRTGTSTARLRSTRARRRA